MSRLAALRTRLRLLFGRRAAEARMDEEIGFHIDMETERLVRAGLPAGEARRRALVAFGGIDKHAEELRAGRGLAWLSGFSLDLKLGLRMLVKYPGLTVVAGIAMAFAICVGAVAFEVLTQVFNPKLPLPQGDRIVALRQFDLQAARVEDQVVHDFVGWRESLKSVEDLAAFGTSAHNLVTPDGPGEPVQTAAMSAAGFRVARVQPILGRPLLEEDEVRGAPPVLVLGYEIWQRRFQADPRIVGRVVQLGTERATVVGVMPKGFAFPVAHQVWVPLRLDPLAHERRGGPSITIFGRLADGATLEEAQAELETHGQVAAAQFPATHEHLRPRVGPYAKSILNVAFNVTGELDLASLGALLRPVLNLPLVLFLLLICGNVALLVFARSATREAEIVVRTVLGASRERIIVQLFAEALVLGLLAAAVGLGLAKTGFKWGMWALQGPLLEGVSLPFWVTPRVSLTTVVYVAMLTLAGAAIVGVLPALKVTRGLGGQLRQASAGGGGFRFGGVWTAVVVSQIAITIPFPLVVWATHAEGDAVRNLHVAMDGEAQFLSARLDLDLGTQPPADTSRATVLAGFQATARELERRLEADPEVAGVTFADRLPRLYHPYQLIDLDAGDAAPLDPRWPGYRISSAHVAPDFFNVLGVGIEAGRGFTAADLAEGARPVIVNRSFVAGVMGGRNPVGRRIRYAHFDESGRKLVAAEQPWYEIVGVVPDMGMAYGSDPKKAGIYHPVPPGGTLLTRVAIHLKGDAASFAPQLRAAAGAVDPSLRLYDVMTFDALDDAELRFYSFWTWFTIALSAVALGLSLAGIYAVMSFTVSQRTREIGIRVALGADRRRVLAAIFRRPLTQVSLGVLAGAGILVILFFGGDVKATPVMGGMLLAYTVVMMGVCLLAWIVPTRRALAVQPSEALRWD